MIESLPGETWLPVPGYEEFYLISDHGRVYALARSRVCGRPGSAPQRRPGYLMKPNPVGNPRTHLCVGLTKDGRRWHAKVHKLVLLAFVGPCPDGLIGLHWDDDPNNNHISNLRYGTHGDNQRDRTRNGTHHLGNKTHCVNGHEFTPENTYHPPGRPKRVCKECTRDRIRSRRKVA